MSAFFSTAFITALSATPGMINGSTVKCVLFREAPVFTQNDARYIGLTTVSQLLALPGWIPVLPGGAPLGNTITVGVRDEGKSNYVMMSQFPFTGLAPSEAKAAAFLRADNTIMFVSNTPFAGEMRVVQDGDSITASPDSTLAGASNRWLFSWADAPTPGGTIVTLSEGPLLLSLGPPDFEPSHTQHVWLYPQRANMIANPSFEKPSPPAAYWASNGTISRVALVNPPISAGRFAGRFQFGGIVVAESNTFPTGREEYWTIQLMAKGVGDCKVGFVYWDDDFDAVSVDWGEETWQLDPDTFIHISVCRFPVQTYQGMLRIEVNGGDLTIDQVLCEKGFLKDWPYFDGDTDYGSRGDFSWYGGEVRQGGSYSLWYNHKSAVFGRMFSRQVEDNELITDETMRAQGICYDWVPAGTIVTPHLDVLYPNDLQLPVPDKVGVLSYRLEEYGDPQGIVNPWGLVALPGLHAHSAGHVTLEVSVQTQSAVHAHTAANVVIFAVPNTPIVPADATHANTATNVTLTEQPHARGDFAVHAIASPEVILGSQVGPPLPVRTGLVGWWDADDGLSLSFVVGSTVYRWHDKSGLDTPTFTRTFANPTSTYSPDRSGTQNGRPTLVFDGVDDIQSTGSFTQAQPLTLFIAFNPSDVDLQGILGSIGGSFQVHAYGGTARLYCGSADLPAAISPGPQRWRVVANGSSSSLAINNGTPVVASTNPGYVTFPGPSTTGNYLSVPTFAVTNDVTIVARIRPTTWLPTPQAGAIASKWRTGIQSWAFRVGITGALQFFASVNGSTTYTVTSSANLSAQPLDWLWVAVTFDADDGAGNKVTRFWTGSNGSTWTQFGTTITSPGTTTIFNSSSPIDIGAIDGGLQQVFPGDIEHVSIRNGIGASGTVGGTEIFRLDGDDYTNPTATTLIASTGQTVTVNRSGTPSTTITPYGNPGTSGTTTGLRLGDRNAATLFKGAMFEIVAYNRVLTAPEITQVEDYLNTKWFVPPP